MTKRNKTTKLTNRQLIEKIKHSQGINTVLMRRWTLKELEKVVFNKIDLKKMAKLYSKKPKLNYKPKVFCSGTPSIRWGTTATPFIKGATR